MCMLLIALSIPCDHGTPLWLNLFMSQWITRYLSFTHRLKPKEEEQLMDIPLTALSLISQEKKKIYTYVVTLDADDEKALTQLCQSQPGFIALEELASPQPSSFVPEPIRITEGLYVIDPSLRAPDGHGILIEAGLAFGTGQHPSTQLLLKWLHHHLLEGLEVCDIGSGSGILSVYAKQRGAARVLAIDIDPVACERTAHHAALNGVILTVTDQMPEGDTYDLVISNCERAVLLTLAPHLETLLKPGGRWVITGVISRSFRDLRPSLPDWPIIEEDRQGPWVLKCFERPKH